MTQETPEGMREALAIVRAKLGARTSAGHRAALEAMLLEISTSDDPLAVVSGLAALTAQVLDTIAQLSGITAEQLLTMIETGLEGPEGTAKS